jgi:hypothetical protein
MRLCYARLVASGADVSCLFLVLFHFAARLLPHLEGDTFVGACLCRNAHHERRIIPRGASNAVSFL